MKKLKLFFVLLLPLLIHSSCQDFFLEPEEQFVQIYFKYGFQNELNTFENTYQKDLVIDGVIKVKFWFTEEEQNKILDKVNAVNYYSMPDTLPKDSINVIIEPDPGEQILRIKYLQEDKTLVWTFSLNHEDPIVKKLFELTNFIITIIESKPEYKRLPPARGGRL